MSRIQFKDRSELDASLASIASLVRLSDDRYRTVVEWVDARRAEEAARLAAHEESMAEIRASIFAESEARAAATAALKQREPWKF